jgi:hypothetical protein
MANHFAFSLDYPPREAKILPKFISGGVVLPRRGSYNGKVNLPRWLK